ncbi:MAG: hypothetical protein DMG65_22965 [Candidatus Angelobacter sp. Gp1-AA117]|nr:MAG: hypothetical protein DMG65_22965 [Candidatus Angelobacter sp. Gp1-AA117]
MLEEAAPYSNHILVNLKDHARGGILGFTAEGAEDAEEEKKREGRKEEKEKKEKKRKLRK